MKLTLSSSPKSKAEAKLWEKADKKAKVMSVLNFKRMLVENAYTFSGVNEIPLERTGLVKVTGINRDTKTVSSNGAGKTRWWHCMLRLFYGRKAMKREKPSDIYNTEVWNFRIEVEFEKSGHTYLVRECKKHSDYEDGLSVLCDNKPWGPKNDPEALRKALQGVLNRSYEEFVGTIIWKQNSDHILVEGTPSERSTWISTFFGLSVYDELYSVFSQKHDNVKSKILGFAETKARRKVIQESIDGFGDVSDAKAKAKRIRVRIQDAITRSSENTKAIEALREKESDLKHLAELKARIDEVGASGKTAVILKSDAEKAKADLQAIQRKIESARSSKSVISEYDELLATRKKSKRKLLLLYQSVFKGDGTPPKSKDLKPLQIEAAERMAVYKATLIRAEKTTLANSKAIKAKRRLDDLGYGDCDMKYLKKMRNVHQDEITENEKIIAKNETALERETLISNHVARCPTCGTKVDVGVIQEALDIAKLRIEDANKAIKRNRKEMDSFEEAITLREEADKRVAGEDIDADAIRKKIAKLELKTLTLEKMIVFAMKYEVSKHRLKELQESYDKAKECAGTDLREAKKEQEEIENTLDRIESLRKDVEQYERLMATYKLEESADLELSNARRKRLALEEESSELQEILTKKRIALDRTKQVIENYNKLETEKSEIDSALEGLAKLERRERIYKSLKKAYDKNGLKMQRLRELMLAIKTRLPVWTNLLFTEKNFKIDVTGNEKKIGFEITQTKIVVDPKTGKKKTVVKRFDAGEASGSERTRISCALMLTMADVASSEKQCTLLVLDELERGLDNQSKEIMANDVIQLLKNKKPSLYLITHGINVDSDVFDAELQVIKQNQQTRTKFITRKGSKQ